YERVVFRRAMDRVLGRPGVRAERTAALAPARGRILEVGIGTGLNLDAYPDGVAGVTALAIDSELDPRAVARAARRRINVQLVTGDATRMPFEDGSFDTAVCTFLLCSVNDGAATVRELHRVLRRGGRLLFLEHVAQRTRGKRFLQYVLEPLSRVVSCGCSLVRDSVSTICDNGFQVDQLVDQDLPAMMWPHRRVVRGVASKVAP